MRPERRLKPGVDGGLRAASWPARLRARRPRRLHREADLAFLRMRLRDDRPVEGVPVSDEHNLFDAPCQCRVDRRTVQYAAPRYRNDHSFELAFELAALRFVVYLSIDYFVINASLPR